MIPSMFVELDALPVTASGKLERNALPAPAWAEPALAAEFEPPRPGVETALAAIWAEIFGVARVGAHDNFFHLGGASIATLRLAELARAAGLQVTPEMVFRHQVLRDLAEAIARAPSTAPELRGDPAVEREPAPPPELGPCNAAGAAPSGAARTARVVIESLGVYLPSRTVSTEEVLRGCDAEMLFPLERMTGIHERPIAGDGEFSIDLAVQAMTRCLALSRHHPADIDLLICCNISRYDAAGSFSFEPSTAAVLRERFGLDNALAFDIGNACAGMFTAINLVDAFIQGGVVRRAMVVSGEYITHLTRTAQREIKGFMDPRLACLTLGDAGVALVLERSTSGTAGFREIELYTLGRHAELCIAKVTDRPHGGAIMLTDAVRQTAVGVKNAVGHATHVLARAQQSPDSCKQLIMHQTSETAIREAMREINRVYGRVVCDDRNTIINLGKRGNTATTTHFVALHDQLTAGRLRGGDRVLFGISGSGQTIGTAIYDLDDLPERMVAGPPASGARTAPARRVIPRRVARSRRVRVESTGTLGTVPEADRTALGMAAAAARACLARSSYDRNDIDLLLYTGIYRDEFLSEPALAAMIAGRLEMNDDVAPDGKKTLVFDILNGQVGFLDACWVASEAILAGKFSNAMVLAAEIENNRAAPPHPLLGLRETAAAVILDVGDDASRGFGRFVFRHWTDEPRRFASRARFEAGMPFLQFERRPDLEQRCVSCIADAVLELLSIEQMTIADIAAILPPQPSPAWIDALAARLGVDRARCIDVTGGGDLFTSSLPHAFEAAPRAGVRPGDVGIVISAGSGGQVGCALYHF
jgi:3-oxoacyl-[acyl-carrier-protein] synthase III